MWLVAVKDYFRPTTWVFLTTVSAFSPWLHSWEYRRMSFPSRNRKASTSMADVVQTRDDLSKRDLEETQLVDQHRRCIEHWNTFS